MFSIGGKKCTIACSFKWKVNFCTRKFYDFIIMNNLPDNEFIMARFIGKLLGEYKLGISDSWYALRIEK